jgi:hypothetical protein
LRGALGQTFLFPGRRDVLSRILSIALPLAVLAAFLSEGRAVIGEDFAVDHPQLADKIPYIIKGMFWNRQMDLWAAMLAIWSLPYLRRRT